MRIAIGCDHGGFALKEIIKTWLAEAGHEIDDVGTYNEESCDYPDFGQKVAEIVLAGGAQRGILICGTGLGMSMTANRVKGIRAALCTDPYMARMAREHNDANVLVLGGRVVGTGLAEEIVNTWLTTEFAGGRHERRINKIDTLE